MSMWSGLGISFGYQDTSSFYTGSAAGDLQYLWDLGFRKIRLVGNTNDATMAFMRTNAILAKAIGFYTIFGTSANGVTLNSTNWTTYRDQSLAEAAHAITYGFDEFVFANEEELRIDNVTIVDPFALVSSYYKPLATSIKNLGYKGIKSFNISNGAESWIYSIARGDIDKVGFNVYGDLVGTQCTTSSFQTRITDFLANSIWGSRLYISEWGTNYNTTHWNNESLKPDTMYDGVSERLQIIQSLAIPSAYFFCWGNTQSEFFAINRGNGELGKWINPLITDSNRKVMVTA